MRGKIQKLMFEKHPFLLPFLVIMLCGLPWWIAYWPGTLQYDSCGQLLQYIGVGKMTAHHPLPVTMVMGILLDIGRAVFHSDNMGIFLYTGLQFLAQCLVFAYTFCVYRKIQVPMWMRWGSLFFYAIFPLLPNWGISYGKDTGYYISFLLFTLVIIDTFLAGDGKGSPWKQILWVVSLLGLVAFRNDGRYVVALTILLLFVFLRNYWKIYIKGILVVVVFLFLVEGVYMPLRNIPSGSIRETLSVPLMQTAHYLDKYGDELTEEEVTVLLSLFEVNQLEELAEAYDENISDDVKALFQEYPDSQELLSYFKVWWKQLGKHPLVYVETYANHCDGYFHPGVRCYEDIIGWFKILDSQSRSDEYLNIYFEIEDTTFRDVLEHGAYWLYELPLIGLLFRPAAYTWILFGCLIYLIVKRRRKEMILLIPGIIVLLICTVSPLNASVRYYLPVMATVPVYLAFCMAKNTKGTENYEKITE